MTSTPFCPGHIHLSALILPLTRLLWRLPSPILSIPGVKSLIGSDSLRPHELLPTRLLSPWNSPGKNTGVNWHSLLQEIFPTKGLTLGPFPSPILKFWPLRLLPWALCFLLSAHVLLEISASPDVSVIKSGQFPRSHSPFQISFLRYKICKHNCLSDLAIWIKQVSQRNRFPTEYNFFQLPLPKWP